MPLGISALKAAAKVAMNFHCSTNNGVGAGISLCEVFHCEDPFILGNLRNLRICFMDFPVVMTYP